MRRIQFLGPACGLLVAVLGMLALEAGLALVGFAPRAASHDPYLGFSSQSPLFEESAGGWVETTEAKHRYFNPQRFRANKPVGTRRVFCLGGSTTYGRPYADTTSFCGWLRVLLSRADPTTRWEVVNAGGISYASYRVARIVDELGAYAPDVMVLYTGHNEFLEERTYREFHERPAWLKGTADLLSRTRVLSLVAAAADTIAPREHRSGALSSEVDAILDRSVGPAAYERDDELHARVLEHFRFNLETMVTRARSYGAEPILVVPASNLEASSPFRSVPDRNLSAAQVAALETARALATAAADPETGIARWRAVLELDPRLPEGHFELGRWLIRAGRPCEAMGSLRRARDEDICALRAGGAFQQAVRNLAAQESVALIDLEEVLLQEGGGCTGLGADHFLDHVHPTVEAHGLLAAAIFDTLQARGIAGGDALSRAELLSEAAPVVRASIDSETRGRALRNLAKVLSWAGKGEEAAALAVRADATLGGDSESRFIRATHALEQGDHRTAERLLRAAVEIDPDYAKAHANLGLILARSGRSDAALDHYGEALRLQPGYANAHYNRAALLSRLGRIEAAIADYRQALRFDPQDEDALYNLANDLLRSGRFAEASETYRRVLELDPTTQDARSGFEEARAALVAAGS